MVSIMRNIAAAAFALVLMAMLLGSVPVVEPARADGGWLPVTIVYNADINGKIEPCG